MIKAAGSETGSGKETDMEQFYAPIRVIMGTDALAEALKDHKKVFLVTDPFMAESGRTAYVTDLVQKLGGESAIFSECHPDPDTDTVSRGVSRLIEFGPDVLVALGGGSSIDAAKAMRYFAVRNCSLTDCPFIAIPTTSGTGSEVTDYAVITDTAKAVKYPMTAPELMPDIAVLDAKLVTSVPLNVTANTGMDVLTHAIEAYTTKSHNDFTDAMAEKAIELVYHYLLKVYREPQNLEYRQRMHNASTLAGMAFSNAGLGLVHGMAHALGASFHIPHGGACALMLPYVMHFNAGCSTSLTPTARRYAMLANTLGIASPSIRQSALIVIRTIRQAEEKMRMPTSIQKAGISEADFLAELDSLTEKACNDPCTAGNLQPATSEEIKDIYEKAYYGKY